MKKILLLLSTLLFVACSSESAEMLKSEAPVEYTIENSEAQEEFIQEDMQARTEEFSGDTQEGIDKKAIEYYEVNSETKNYDKVLEDIYSLIENYDGYVTNVSEGGIIPRYVYIEAKIPKPQTDEFLSGLQENEELVVFNKVKSSTDITDQYRDNELRLKNLEKKLERLYELQANQDNITDLLEVELAIDDTTFEIENIKNQQSNYDTLTTYSQISINLNEVATDSKSPSKVEISFIERLQDAFERSGRNFVEGFKNVIVFLVLNLIPIIILLVIILAIYIVTRKRKQEKKVPEKNTDQENNKK